MTNTDTELLRITPRPLVWEATESGYATKAGQFSIVIFDVDGIVGLVGYPDVGNRTASVACESVLDAKEKASELYAGWCNKMLHDHFIVTEDTELAHEVAWLESVQKQLSRRADFLRSLLGTTPTNGALND